ncbi:MAG: hypothetical protein CFE23_03260 [Flavobacterium sp. BFFFF1]|nr:MAG: hypothetical protein CFE23_03260 [Flavobacterium sp. BFFFF1]
MVVPDLAGSGSALYLFWMPLPYAPRPSEKRMPLPPKLRGLTQPIPHLSFAYLSLTVIDIKNDLIPDSKYRRPSTLWLIQHQ